MPNNGLSEADTRAKLIDPALSARGWDESMIRREETPGRVAIGRGRPYRSYKRMDYVLRVPNQAGGEPLATAILEAKREGLDPGRGIEQVKRYGNLAKRHNVRFVYSTNGHRFLEHDRANGTTSDLRPMSEFPTPSELIERYGRDLGTTFGSESARPLATDYPKGRDSVRYYQDAAIRAVFEKLAKGDKRALLSMATGTGKTLVAVNILKRIESAGQLRRALFVCDRDALREQARNALHQIFGDDVATARSNNPEKNARVVVSTYQTLNVDGVTEETDVESSYIMRHYGEDYFSHIVIDECHRSAWNKWSQVLTLNSNAVHIGLTATPREFEQFKGNEEADMDREITRDNIRYFGEPVYEYGIGPGMDDGYLALMLVKRYELRLAGNVEPESETGLTQSDLASAELLDATTGEPADIQETREVYGAPSLEQRIVLSDRRREMCDALFNSLSAQDEPEQKTIVFCVNVNHAVAVANSLNNLYHEWCHERGRKPKADYAFPCTGEIGSDNLADFRGSSQRFFIATTADLLTTGVDIPWVENIVFFRYIRSPMLFHQMIGRGTRIDEASGKLAFTIHDFTDATRLLGKDLQRRTSDRTHNIKPSTPLPEKSFEVYGLQVEARPQGNMIGVANDDGAVEWVTQHEYERRIAVSIKALMPDAESMRKAWSEPRLRSQLVDNLPGGPNYAMALRDLSGMEDFDLFDVLANLAYCEDALSREERARRFEASNSEWLAAQTEATRNTLLAICSQFRKGGIDDLEDESLMRTPEVEQAGGRNALSQYRDGGAGAAMRDLKLRLFRS